MTIRIDETTPGAAGTEPERPLGQAMLRGAIGRCPACGKGALFGKYLKVVDACDHCHEDYRPQRADDAPAYFVILIIGHVVAGGALTLEQTMAPPLWVHAAVWLPVTLGLCLWMLPRAKGALVALQWALRMHGFGSAHADEPEPDPAAEARANAPRG